MTTEKLLRRISPRAIGGQYVQGSFICEIFSDDVFVQMITAQGNESEQNLVRGDSHTVAQRILHLIFVNREQILAAPKPLQGEDSIQDKHISGNHKSLFGTITELQI